MPIIVDHLNCIYEQGTNMEVAALKDINLVIPDGQFIGLIGHTGSGKSTLVQHLNGLIEATSGTVYFNGEDIYDKDYDRKKLRSKVGLVFQYPEHQLFETDVFKDVCFGPKNLGLDRKETELRAYKALKMVGLPDEYFYQSPFDLSGGQKRRVAIAGVLAMEPDVLILDEPGNNLDIPTLTILEDFLNSFVGIVITVSHDRYFLDNVVDRIFEFDGNGHLQQYEGGYTDYLETKQKRTSQETSESGNALFGKSGKGKSEEGSSKSSRDWKQNRKTKLKFSYKEQKEFETIDETIAALEERLEQLDKEMAANATNAGKLRELSDEQQETQQKLDEKMDRWVYLNDLAEKIAEQE